MKRKILQSCSLLVLAILLAVASVQSQTIGTYDAHIPFDFNIGKISYESGDYTIRLKDPNYLAPVLTIINTKDHTLHAAILLKNGSRAKTGKAILVFDRYGSRYVLKQILSPGFGFSAPESKVIKQLAENLRRNPERISLVLTMRE